MHTQVAIIGAGPAGLLLSHLLGRHGVEAVVLEARTREHVEARQRAGILEQGTVDVLRGCGAGARMDLEGLVHDGLELRFGGARHRIAISALTSGRTVMAYPQTEMVRDLIALRLQAGAALLFEAEAVAVEGIDSDRPSVRYRHVDVEQTITADVVVGADGFHGIARRSIPGDRLRISEYCYPYSWLGILASVPPSCDVPIYAHSGRGFALHSMRGTEISRLYLQVPPDTDPDSWPDARIWDELDARLAVDEDWTLQRGPITEKTVTPMRSFVATPMRRGRLFLAGDAAHIVPPTGAKGLNLAVADVTLLGTALVAWYGAGDPTLVDGYSDAALRRVWRAQHFSYFMTTLLHIDPAASDYELQLQLTHLDYVVRSTHAAASIAENYTGLPHV
jgi:p-hydroxybenzoate 3-monooxygenase